jgi:hypothetical protein
MNPLGHHPVWSFLSTKPRIQVVDNTRVRADSGVLVRHYAELAERVADLCSRNPNFVLFYRGQSRDHRNQRGNTSIKPGLFRPHPQSGRNPGSQELATRYQRLEAAERGLLGAYLHHGLFGRDRMQRYQVLRWAILQHYEVCPTPLLDVTHSLRVAASFASHASTSTAYVYVLAVPNLAGVITASSEEGLQILRLSSICPSIALRPHFQEGYLLGEYPELRSLDQKALVYAHEIDFGLRLLAKFRFRPRTFWQDPSFPMIPKEALYPDDRDGFFPIAAQIRKSLD